MTRSARRVTLADLEIGMVATHEADVDETTVGNYALLTGDHNPVHEDSAYASETRFGRPIAHGLLVASYVQTALTALVAPGGVSVSYRIELHAPVSVGTRVAARAVCTHLDPVRRRATFAFTVTSDPGAAVAVSGEAIIAFPREDLT